MNEIISGIINNLFFVLFPLFLYHLFSQNKQLHTLGNQKYVLILTFSISIILCIYFPFSLPMGQEYRFDIRQVPLILGTLYGGYFVGFWLFLISVIARLPLGGDGIYTAILNQFVLFAFIPLIRTYYFKLTHIRRVFLATSISIASLVFNCIAGYLLFNDVFLEIWDVWLFIIFTQAIAMIFTVITIEQIIKSMYIQQVMIKKENLDIVSHMAASISHEIRNPLQVIKGFLQFMKSNDHDEQKQKEYIEIMEKEIKSAEAIITEYLTFAKPTFDKITKIHTKDELSSMLNIIRGYASYSNVEIKHSFVENVFIEVDSQKFKQCIMNILRNCIESMEEDNGKGKLQINSMVVKDRFVITFKDNGKGMNEEQISRLGEPYFSTKENGTGLGMMVVYSIIKHMNGTLNVQSNLGEGTTFVIEIPIHHT